MPHQNKPINKDYCEIIAQRALQFEDKFKKKFGNRKVLHLEGTIDNWFWEDIPEYIKQHLAECVYPFDKPIMETWFSIIDGSEEHPGFHGLHQDLYATEEDMLSNLVREKWISSVIVYKTEDFKGGQFIIGGDGWTDGNDGNPEYDATRASRRGNLSHRLKVIENQDVGSSTVWSDFTIHGVAEVTQGRRISMMIAKDGGYAKDAK